MLAIILNTVHFGMAYSLCKVQRGCYFFMDKVFTTLGENISQKIAPALYEKILEFHIQCLFEESYTDIHVSSPYV